MNPTTHTYQDNLPTQLAKEGLTIAEAPLKKLLADRAALIKSLYGKEMTEAGFNRAKAEEDMIKAVAGYNVAVEGLLKAQTEEMQRMREQVQESAARAEKVWVSEPVYLKFRMTEAIVKLRLAQKGRDAA